MQHFFYTPPLLDKMTVQKLLKFEGHM